MRSGRCGADASADASESAATSLSTSGASRATASDDDAPRRVGDVVHGSDSVDAAKRELAIYFNKDELVEWTPAAAKWVTE